MARKSKPQLDANQTAFAVAQQIARISEAQPTKNPAAVALGRLGGLRGGPARAKNLGKKGLSEANKKAINARWDKVLTPERRRELARLRREKGQK